MLVTLVLARVIAQSGAPMPVLDDGGVLLVKRHDVFVGACDGVDAGPSSDGGIDAPADADVDAGPSDAGAGDAGAPDAGCESIPGDAITLMVQPRFSRVTSGTRFALLMVTPARPIVETDYGYVFSSLAEVTAPKVIVHESRVQDPDLGKQCGSTGGGCGFAPADPDPYFTPPGLGDGGFGDNDGGYSVDLVGPYEVVRAQPADTAELETWLGGLGYLTLPADLAAVAPYIARGYTVVAIRVKIDSTPEGQLTAIALTWPGDELRLPAALGTPAGGTPRETVVYISGPGPYQLPGASIPFAWRTSSGQEGFLTKNIVVIDSDGNPDDDPVAVPILGDIQVRETRDEYVTKYVPVNDCGDLGCGCRECSAQRPMRLDLLAVAGAVLLIVTRKRRRPRR